MTNEGNKLTQEILKNLGFEKEVIKDRDGDEMKWWNKNGFSIHENSWWLTELDEDDELLEEPISSYDENETPPEITFSFATYVKGDGGFKGGFSIKTDTQLNNLYFSLTNTNLTPTNNTDLVLLEVKEERVYQDEKWGVKDYPILDPQLISRHPDRMCEEYELPSEIRAKALCRIHSERKDLTYMHILVEEVSEVASCKDDVGSLRKELIQVAAVAVAMIESIDRTK